MSKAPLSDPPPEGAGGEAGRDCSHLLNARREQSWSVFQRAVAANPAVFTDPLGVAYDRRNLAVSKDMLDLGETEMVSPALSSTLGTGLKVRGGLEGGAERGCGRG